MKQKMLWNRIDISGLTCSVSFLPENERKGI